MPCVVVQQATEYRRSIKPWKTKPIYRAHAADKRRWMTIGNQSIIGDWEGTHSSAPNRCVCVSLQGGACDACCFIVAQRRQAHPITFSERAYILRLRALISLLRYSNVSKKQFSSRVWQ